MSLSTNTTYRVYCEKLGGSDPTTFVGEEGELFFDPSGTSLKISDGTTAGGQSLSSSLEGTMTGSIIPDTNAAYDIGSSSYKVRDLYLDSNSLHIGSVDIAENNGKLVLPAVEMTGHIIPDTNAAYDLGNAEYKIRYLFQSDPSDARLKTDVVDYTGGLAFVESLRVVDFTWKEDVDVNAGKRETGLIAQEVKEALDASNYNSWRLHTDGETQGVDKTQLIVALVSAVQELSAEVKELRERLGE